MRIIHGYTQPANSSTVLVNTPVDKWIPMLKYSIVYVMLWRVVATSYARPNIKPPITVKGSWLYRRGIQRNSKT